MSGIEVLDPPGRQANPAKLLKSRCQRSMRNGRAGTPSSARQATDGTKVAKKMGRPQFPYTATIASYICVQLALGRSLRKIVKDSGMPSQSLVYEWLNKRPDFVEMYSRAREFQAHILGDEILEIADKCPLLFSIDERSGIRIVRVDPMGVQRQKLRIDARKWMAARLQPRKYGLRR